MQHAFKALIFLSFILLSSHAYALPPGVEAVSDIPYGEHEDLKLDVYSPVDAKDAPVIFMVHGGGWRGGDKANSAEYEAKVAHWVTKGFVFISANHRTLPEIAPVGQAKDVATALAFAQQNAHTWGGAADKFILMGHSSGAHLVALVSAQYSSLTKKGVVPWLATIPLDTSAFDVVARMTSDEPSEFYRSVFGNTEELWKKASPQYVVDSKIPPVFPVCSRHSNVACGQASLFLEKAREFGMRGGRLLGIDLSHNDINAELGKEVCYTNIIDDFLLTLSPEINTLLASHVEKTREYCASE